MIGEYATLAAVVQDRVFLIEDPPGSHKGIEYKKLTADKPPPGANPQPGCWVEAVNGAAKTWMPLTQQVYLPALMLLVEEGD